MKPVIFVDVDGTVADSMPWWLSLYNVKHETCYQVNQITDYSLSWLSGIEEFFTDYRGVQPVVGAFKALTTLSIYYRIVFVTVGFGQNWLTYNLGVQSQNLIRIKDRSLLRGYALIDDYDENLLDFQGDRRYLVRQPWSLKSTKFSPQTWEEITEDLLNEKNNSSDSVLFAPV